jgi:DNA-binding response OmpR family regulator
MNEFPLLLVEDDENDVLFFQRALQKAGVNGKLFVARDGQEAIDYFSGVGEFSDRNQFPFPRLTVLDLNLPGKHGLQVLQAVHALTGILKTPVVVLTSSTSDRDMREAYQFGANSYLVKPLDSEALVELVKLIKLYWLQANQLPRT